MNCDYLKLYSIRDDDVLKFILKFFNVFNDKSNEIIAVVYINIIRLQRVQINEISSIKNLIYVNIIYFYII